MKNTSYRIINTSKMSLFSIISAIFILIIVLTTVLLLKNKFINNVPKFFEMYGPIFTLIGVILTSLITLLVTKSNQRHTRLIEQEKRYILIRKNFFISKRIIENHINFFKIYNYPAEDDNDYEILEQMFIDLLINHSEEVELQINKQLDKLVSDIIEIESLISENIGNLMFIEDNIEEKLSCDINRVNNISKLLLLIRDATRDSKLDSKIKFHDSLIEELKILKVELEKLEESFKEFRRVI